MSCLAVPYPVGRERVRVRVFSLWFLAALLGLPFFSFTLPAQTPPPKELPGRFLFIVDTSAAMRRRAPAIQKAVEKLMRSGLSGQLRPGDTVGVWTFDEELHAGRLPLQIWSNATSEPVASNVVAFIKAQPYQKKSRFEVVAPALERIVKSSTKLTVLLVTDGEQKAFGTPFDREISSAFERNFKMQQKAREPFITVLRASRGQLINASVNLMPWPVEFPAFPPEPALVEAPKPKPLVPTPAPHPPVPSLIVIGKKPEADAATNTPAATNVIEGVTATNAPLKAETTIPSITPTPPQLNPSELRSSPASTPAPVITETVTPPTEPITPDSNPGAPPPAIVENAPTGPPVTSTPPLGVEPIPTSSPAPPRPAESAQVPPANPSVELPVVTRSSELPATPLAGPATNEAARTTPLAPAALAIQPVPGFPRLWMLALGITLVLLAIGWFFVQQHRARNADRVSLITRSMDRDRK